MTEQPENYTAAQASDPQTPAQTLADIAALRPDLRPAVASNPSTYPALLEWLKSLGEPAVDAALAAREQATQVLPTTPPATASPAQPAQPWAAAPAPGQYAPAQPGPYAPAQAGQYAPAQPGYPAPGVTPGYAGTPPKSGSGKTVLWIVLAIVLIIILGVGAVIWWVFKAAQDAADDITEGLGQITRTTEPATDDPMRFGDDPQLDALYTACASGDWKACDDLYAAAPIDSEYFEFGDTCGGAWDAGTTTFCVEAMGGEDPEPVELSGAEIIYLDALMAACAAEDWGACDDLFWDSPVDSEYEAFGDTCGGRTEGIDFCVAELGGGVEPPDPMTRGSHAGLDALWDACEADDAEACDLLYWNSPIDSEYEAFAQSRR